MIEKIHLDPQQADEVLFRVLAAGVYHSLHTYRGESYSIPPLVLSHEGAGTIEPAGSNATSIKPGDRLLAN